MIHLTSCSSGTLDVALSSSDVQSIEAYIALLGNHLEFAVKHLFESDFKLCNDVFERVRFECLDGLLFQDCCSSRADFNRLFGGAACIEIQNFTRDLIKKLIDGAADIFWELLVQVEIQRQNYKGARIGDQLGDSWLKEHDQYKEYYSTAFLRDSWGKLPSHLSREGLILFSGGHATARDHVKKRLKSFNDAFDEMYKKQSTWVVPEKDLRDRVCQQIVQAIVPVYRSYMQNYGPLVEKDASSSKYVRYTVVALEKILSLFTYLSP